MDHSIDYSSLPMQRPAFQTRRKPELFLYGLLVILVVALPFVASKQPLLAVADFGLILAVFAAQLKVKSHTSRRFMDAELKRTEEAVRLFAERNGWQFEGSNTVDAGSLPNVILSGESAQQRYRITGAMHGQAFEITILADGRTVLRTQGPLSARLAAPGSLTGSDNGWNYVYMHEAADTVDRMKALLQPLLAAPNS